MNDATRNPRVFVWMRNTPRDADPWDEANWTYANPALGDFLTLADMRQQALDARNDPTKENKFRQLKLNQWVNQTVRWCPMHLYDACSQDPWVTPEQGLLRLQGRPAFAGFDLSAKDDLSAWCLMFPPQRDGEPVECAWRFWLPENKVGELSEVTDGKSDIWIREGWIKVTEGSFIDYDQLIEDIAEDAGRYSIQGMDADVWSTFPIILRAANAAGTDPETEVGIYANDFKHMSPGMDGVLELIKGELLEHHENPVVQYCFDNVEARIASFNPDVKRPDKPERNSKGKRIDAVPTTVMAWNAWKMRGAVEEQYVPYRGDNAEVEYF
jgi:phage terminase large subunit-like protein